jgi:4-alpha-glucanotransferase
VRLGRATCGDLVEAESREWWVANGLGAYAAGTIAGTLTRHYHGLLIAPVDPPLGRRLLLAKADARIIDDRREYPLATNRWADGSVSPTGYTAIETFHLDGRMPVWMYACADARVEQRIWLEHGALGSISEIFDGAPPHAPRGAPAQAWSVATALEAWWQLTRARHVTGA